MEHDPEATGPGVKKQNSSLAGASSLYPSHITAHSITKKAPAMMIRSKNSGMI